MKRLLITFLSLAFIGLLGLTAENRSTFATNDARTISSAVTQCQLQTKMSSGSFDCDVKTFRAIKTLGTTEYALWADKSHCFILYEGVLSSVPGCDAKHFRSLGHDVVTDGKKVWWLERKSTLCESCKVSYKYIEGNSIPWVDVRTFTALGGEYFRDKSSVFLFGKKIEGLSPKTKFDTSNQNLQACFAEHLTYITPGSTKIKPLSCIWLSFLSYYNALSGSGFVDSKDDLGDYTDYLRDKNGIYATEWWDKPRLRISTRQGEGAHIGNFIYVDDGKSLLTQSGAFAPSSSRKNFRLLFKAANFTLFTDGTTLWRDGMKQNAEVKTFRILWSGSTNSDTSDRNYQVSAVDANNCFLFVGKGSDPSVKEADPVLKWCDPKSFAIVAQWNLSELVLALTISADAKYVWVNGIKTDADPATFRIVSDDSGNRTYWYASYGADKNACYTIHSDQMETIKNCDPKTFHGININKGYTTDGAYIFRGNEIVPNADPKTFVVPD